MKPVLALPIVLALLSPLVLKADEPTETPPAETPRALPLNPTLIRNLQRAVQRLPADALRSRESAATDVASESTDALPAQPVDLSGRWLLTLPAGYQYRAAFDALGENRYRLRDAVAFSGVYQLNGDVLQLVEPTNTNLNVFDWQLHNVNSMTLVDETGASGADYVGATLGRQVEADTADFPRKITAVGRPAVPRPRSTERTAASSSREATLIGTAHHDQTHGPYLETDDTVVFLTGIDAWPAEVLGRSVSVAGTLRPFLIQDDGETLRAQQLEVQSWTLATQLDVEDDR